MPASTMPRPAGVKGTAVSSEATRATKKAPLMPSEMSKPEGIHDEEQPQRLRRPDEHREQADERQLCAVDREDALLEAIVEPDDARGQGQAMDEPRGRSCAA